MDSSCGAYSQNPSLQGEKKPAGKNGWTKRFFFSITGGGGEGGVGGRVGERKLWEILLWVMSTSWSDRRATSPRLFLNVVVTLFLIAVQDKCCCCLPTKKNESQIGILFDSKNITNYFLFFFTFLHRCCCHGDNTGRSNYEFFFVIFFILLFIRMPWFRPLWDSKYLYIYFIYVHTYKYIYIYIYIVICFPSTTRFSVSTQHYFPLLLAVLTRVAGSARFSKLLKR